MAQSAKEIDLGWAGGLHTSLDATKIGANELADMSNAITRDGNARMDQRYILAAEQQSGSRTCTGSGWGKFQDEEEYLTVLDNQLYFVDLTTALAFTSVTGGSVTNEDHSIQQFAEHLYVASETDGISRKTIGLNDYGGLVLPTAPAAAPTSTQNSGGTTISDFSGSSATAPQSTAIDGTGDYWNLVYAGAGSVGNPVKEFSITYDTSPDLRPTWQYHDIIKITINKGATTAALPELFFTNGGTEYKAIKWREDGGGPYDVYYRLQNTSRSNRTAISKLRFEFSDNDTGSKTMKVFEPVANGVWLSLESTYNPGSGPAQLQPLRYAYTYYNGTTAKESSPSPILTVTTAEQNPNGEWRDIVAPFSAQAGVTKIRIYRVVDEGSAGDVYYQLEEINNPGSGSVTHTDKRTLEEVRALTTYTKSVLPTTGVSAMTVWQNRLVIAKGELVYISRDSEPLAFIDIDDPVDEFDEARAFTYYPDDKQAETVYGFASQDALYVITDQSVRSLFGNTPSNWRARRLPEAEGACGKRAFCGYKNGVLVLTTSGRLLYLNNELSQPEEVSIKVRGRIGNSGIAALATTDAVVGVRPSGEIEIRSGASYYLLDTDGTWRKGTHTHATHSLLYVQGQPVRWIGTNGKLYQGGSDTYVTDGGTTGTNGTAVTWYITTGKFLSKDRFEVKRLFYGDAVETVNGSDASLLDYPKVDIISTETGTVNYKKEKSNRWKHTVGSSNMGRSFQFKLYGDKATVYEELKVGLELIAEAYAK